MRLPRLQVLLVAIAAPLLLVTLPAPAAAGDRPLTLQIALRDGQAEALAFDGFDEKRLVFKFKTGKDKREIALRDMAALDFAPPDSGVAAPDSVDVLCLRDGRMLPGLFRRLDDDQVKFLVAGSGRKAGKFGNKEVQRVVFGRRVLDVDRHEYGTSFNLLGDDLEVALSASFAEEVVGTSPILGDTLVANYVNALGQRIATASKRPELAYSFTVIDSRVVNAFTVGGGKVFVYRGLIEQMGDEAELAGVLAHEIGHVVGKHTAVQLTNNLLMQGIVLGGGELLGGNNAKRREVIQQAGGAIAYFRQLKYSRDDEREADFLAIYNLYQMGYDPRAMTSVFETLRRSAGGDPTKFEVFFQEHPSSAERIDNTNTELPKLVLENLRLDSASFPAVKDRLAQLPYPLLRHDLIRETVQVPSSSYKAYTLSLTPGAWRDYTINGHFVASGGSGNDIRILLFDPDNFLNWKNGHEARALHDSGTLTAAEMSMPITADGDFFLILDNKFSWMTDKAVQCEVFVNYRE